MFIVPKQKMAGFLYGTVQIKKSRFILRFNQLTLSKIPTFFEVVRFLLQKDRLKGLNTFH